MLRIFTATPIVLFCLWLTGCAGIPEDDAVGARPVGELRCESFFIYDLCVADLDRNGDVDYMYFDDSREIFMFEPTMRADLARVLPFHPCAIPMSDNNRRYSSQLLYSDSLSFSQRLSVKAKLAVSYRAAQPAVSACNTVEDERSPPTDTSPFGMDESWGENWDEGAS